MKSNESSERTFGARLAVGLGFFTLSMGGLLTSGGAAMEAALDSTAALAAEMHGDTAQQASFNRQHAEDVGIASGAATVAMASGIVGGYLFRGAWTRIMRLDGHWAGEPGAPPLQPGQPLSTEAAATGADAQIIPLVLLPGEQAA